MSGFRVSVSCHFTGRRIIAVVNTPGRHGRKRLETIPVGDVMTKSPKTVGEDTPVETALSFIRNFGFRRLPVVNESKKLVGLVALDDILMLLAEEFREVHRVIERETPRAAADAV